MRWTATRAESFLSDYHARDNHSTVELALDKDGVLMTDLTPADIAKLREDGTISGGMIPKLETCVKAVEAGAEVLLRRALRPDGESPSTARQLSL